MGHIFNRKKGGLLCIGHFECCLAEYKPVILEKVVEEERSALWSLTIWCSNVPD